MAVSRQLATTIASRSKRPAEAHALAVRRKFGPGIAFLGEPQGFSVAPSQHDVAFVEAVDDLVGLRSRVENLAVVVILSRRSG